jgi:membrane-associated phospholipid phosphatase
VTHRRPSWAAASRAPRRWWLSPRASLLLILGGAAVLAALAWGAGCLGGRSVDRALLNFFDQQQDNSPWLHIADLANRGVVVIVAAWGGLLLAGAIADRDVSRAVMLVIVLLGSVLVCEVLKHLVTVHHGRLGVGTLRTTDHTWPSTHASALGALVIETLFAHRTRVGRAPLAVALGLALSLCLLIAGAHFATDIVGGWLAAAVVAGAASLAAAVTADILTARCGQPSPRDVSTG